jgi:hypothetical protein
VNKKSLSRLPSSTREEVKAATLIFLENDEVTSVKRAIFYWIG